ncbi:hypothetical protein [Trebonia sp.]|uniref:hypothetical protein n=1 Tax=Trebonia sp. TaxID=2767075 RepID=UPI002601F7DB|nr:hypothetical protein [Trebonia sp.]
MRCWPGAATYKAPPGPTASDPATSSVTSGPVGSVPADCCPGMVTRAPRGEATRAPRCPPPDVSANPAPVAAAASMMADSPIAHRRRRSRLASRISACASAVSDGCETPARLTMRCTPTPYETVSIIAMSSSGR